MYCVKCGREISNDVKFCKYCGAKTRINESATNISVEGGDDADVSSKLKNSFIEIDNNLRGMNYDVSQIMSIVFAFMSLICYLVAFVFRANWILFFACLYFGYLCLKKEQYNSILMAISISVFAGKEMLTNFILIVSKGYYNNADLVRMSIEIPLEIALIALYWLIVMDKVESQKGRDIISYIVSVVFLILIVFRICFLVNTSLVLSNLGFAFVMISHLVIFLSTEKNIINKIKNTFRGGRYNVL